MSLSFCSQPPSPFSIETPVLVAVLVVGVPLLLAVIDVSVALDVSVTSSADFFCVVDCQC